MKEITTKIPDKAKKKDYALIHRKTYENIVEYLDELPKWIKEDGIEDWVGEVHNEFESLRRL